GFIKKCPSRASRPPESGRYKGHNISLCVARQGSPQRPSIGPFNGAFLIRSASTPPTTANHRYSPLIYRKCGLVNSLSSITVYERRFLSQTARWRHRRHCALPDMGLAGLESLHQPLWDERPFRTKAHRPLQPEDRRVKRHLRPPQQDPLELRLCRVLEQLTPDLTEYRHRSHQQQQRLENLVLPEHSLPSSLAQLRYHSVHAGAVLLRARQR